jgi:small membrane protein
MPIQYILIALILVFIFRLIFKLKAKDIKSVAFFGWLIIWLVAIVIIALPEITSQLAQLVGVTRGVDLVVYSSIILILFLMFRMLMRIEKMEKNITKMVRDDATSEDIKK